MLREKNALVTGARKGIGRSVVELLAQEGVNIWACSHAPDGKFEADMAQLATHCGVWIQPVYFDCADEVDIKEKLMAIARQHDPIHILVNNAGVPHGALLQMTSMKTMREVFQINYFAPMQISQIISRKMMKQKQGVIVNVSSVEGLIGNAGYTSYGASKAALAFSTKSMAQELAPYGVRVNAVAPGLVDTSMGAEMDERSRQRMLQSSAMHRMGRPEEVAETIVWLCSSKASFVNGQVVRVDGGM